MLRCENDRDVAVVSLAENGRHLMSPLGGTVI